MTTAEIAGLTPVVGIRDTEHPSDPVLAVGRRELAVLLADGQGRRARLPSSTMLILLGHAMGLLDVEAGRDGASNRRRLWGGG